MTYYRGNKKTQLQLNIGFFSTLLFSILITILIPSWPYQVLYWVFALLALNLIYQGMVTHIALSDTHIYIKRTLSTKKIAYNDIAFCAVHGLPDNKYLIYCFVRSNFLGQSRVKGIKGTYTFEQLVGIMAQDDGSGTTNLDINFHRAKKVPTAFVEDAEDLKTKLLLAVDQAHHKAGRLTQTS